MRIREKQAEVELVVKESVEIPEDTFPCKVGALVVEAVVLDGAGFVRGQDVRVVRLVGLVKWVVGDIRVGIDNEVGLDGIAVERLLVTSVSVEGRSCWVGYIVGWTDIVGV